MKIVKIIKKLLIYIFILFLLSGCCSENYNKIQTANILITASHGVGPCELEVKSDGIIEVTTDFNYCSNKRKFKKLSKKNMKKVDELITKVKDNSKLYEGYQIDDAIAIYAEIEGNEYYSLFGAEYGNDSWLDNYIDENVQNLAYTLLELVPETKTIEKLLECRNNK